MATYRIGIGSEFQIKDDAVGVGKSTTGLGNLRIDGTLKASGLSASGVSTFISYSGFTPDEISGDVTLTGEHLTTGDIVVGTGKTFTVSVGATVDVGSVESVSIGTHFSLPVGDINDRPEVPVEGTVRFNKDLNTLEFYNGVDWRQFTVNGASTRGLVIGGYKPGATHKRVETFNISTRGNATFFGTPSIANAYETAGFGSKTRAFNATDGSYTKQIDYFILASQSNGIDFGELTGTYGYGSALSSQTRGIVHAGYGHPSPGANLATLDYIEMATVGNAIGFGNLTRINNTVAGFASPTRGIFAGGSGSPAPTTTVDTVIIASKADAVEWGEISYLYGSKGASNTVRGILSNAGGLESYQISTGGNSVDFGHRSRDSHQDNCCASSTRVVMAGGSDVSGGGNVFLNIIEYVTIATLGNAEDFGDLSEVNRSGAGGSDSHGGLGGY